MSRFRLDGQIEKPDEVKFTVKITMSIKDWKTLRAQLHDAYPAWKLTSAIDKMITQAEKDYSISVSDEA